MRHPHPTLRHLLMAFSLMLAITTHAQHFSIETQSDTLSYLLLRTKTGTNRWQLKFPVYRLCEGDIDGDGIADAMVGVVKTTRFDPNVARRIFLFKNVHGRVRPLWMGSRFGGILEDFRYADGHLFTLQSTTDGRYAVVRHCWRKFGLGVDSILISNVDRATALSVFDHPK